MGVINQIILDWQTQPFVQLTIEDENCPIDTEPVFEKIWSGTREGCYQLDVGSGGKDGKIKHGMGKVMIVEEMPGCGTIVNPVPSVKMTKFNGKIICGKRGGATFENLVRPDN